MGKPVDNGLIGFRLKTVCFQGNLKYLAPNRKESALICKRFKHLFGMRAASLLLLCLRVTWLCGQTYPTTLVAGTNNGGALYPDEWSDPVAQPIYVTLWLNDFSVPSWEVKLQFELRNSTGVLFHSDPNATATAPITLVPGVPLTLKGSDLSDVFNYNHLVFESLTRTTLEKNQRLAEGQYSFCFTVVDFKTGRPLSKQYCSQQTLALYNPPTPVWPKCGTQIDAIAPLALPIQWQFNGVDANTAANFYSEFTLYEVTGNWNDPQTAFYNQQIIPIWKSDLLTTTNVFYGSSQPPLESGKRYVFTVKASDGSQRARFKNNGLSPPCWFQYGCFTNDTLHTIQPADSLQFTLHATPEFSWKKPDHAWPQQQLVYELKIVPLKPGQSPTAALSGSLVLYSQLYLPTSQTVVTRVLPPMIWANVLPMQPYAWQVTAYSCNQKVAVCPPTVFIGPPPLDGILAAGFYCPVTRVRFFDKTKGVLTATCSAQLPIHDQKIELQFAVNQITVSSLGDNTWLLINGEVRDRCPLTQPTLAAAQSPNALAVFGVDSICIQPTALWLGGKLKTAFSLPVKMPAPPQLLFTRGWLQLSPAHHWLTANQFMYLEQPQDFALKQPNDFRMHLTPASACLVYQNKITYYFTGCVVTPAAVKNVSGQRAQFCFTNQQTLDYFSDSLKGESLMVGEGQRLSLTPLTYTFDNHITKSPSSGFTPQWTGLVVKRARIECPEWPDAKNQLRLPSVKNTTVTFSNNDTLYCYIDQYGWSLRNNLHWNSKDTLYFNTFLCQQASYLIHLDRGELKASYIKGTLWIPFVDSVNAFPWRCDIDEEGFREGYLEGALSGTSFTINGKGGTEQTVLFTIRQALFSQQQAVVMDVTANWPWLNSGNLALPDLTVWGNGEVGFSVPNGTMHLVSEIQTKVLGYPYLLTRVGCGRTGRLYAFGLSGEAVIDEDMSGEIGPPQLNMYSLYQTGKRIQSDSTTIDSLQLHSGNTSSSAQLLQQANALYDLPGFNRADSGMLVLNRPATTASINLLATKVIQTAKQLSDFIFKIKPLLKEDALSPHEWRLLTAFSAALESETALQLQQAGTSNIINFFLNKLVESLANRATLPIRKVADKAVGTIRRSANQYIYEPVKVHTDKVLDACFSHIQRQLIAATDASLEPIIHNALTEIKTQLTATIYAAVQDAFEKEAIAPLCDFIANAVAARAVNEIRTIVLNATTQLMSKGWQSELDFGLFAHDAYAALRHVSDTVTNALLRLNGKTFIATGERIASDILKSFDWQAIAQDLLAQLISKGITSALANQLATLLPQSAGPFVSSALSAIKFDFSHLDKKLKNGEVNKMVTFDPTNIYIESPAADIRGQLKLLRNDPVYGDCFKAEAMVRLKVPNKDNPKECTAKFTSGKVEQGASRFSYWFAALQVSGLQVSVTPVPVIWDGVEGHCYKHMRLLNGTMVPDGTNKFGVGCVFYFFDMPTGGKTWLMNAGLDVVFNDKGFNTEMTTDASILNFRKSGARYVAPGLISGKGTLGYYKTQNAAHFSGNLMVKLNTEPILCLGGNMGFDLESPQKWSFWLGTPSAPIGYKVLCKDNFQHTGYFQLHQSGMELQLKKVIQFSAASGWINVSGVKVKGAVSFSSGYELTTAVEWEPQFLIKDASFQMNAAGNLLLTIDASGVQTVYTLAAADFKGLLQLKSQPDMELHGNVSANVQVLNYAFTFTTDVHYNLTKQQIMIQ
jgi:hypothetical protein